MRGTAVVALLVVLGACEAAAPDEPAPQTIEALRARIQRELEVSGLPGVGLAIVEGGEVVYAGGVGLADRERGTAVTAETWFRVGSITKSLVALAILTLRDDGRLSLDAKLAAIAPEITVPNPWEATHPVRVAHVLEHTAGFDDMHPAELVSTRGPDVPLRDALAVYPASRRPRWPPGTRMAYANPGYTVAGYLIEKLTGRAYEDYVRDRLLVPIGMPNATLRVTPDVQARLARGYDGRGAEVPIFPLLHRPAGSLVASPAELAQLVRFFLHRGKVGDAQVVAEASVQRAEHGETLPYAGYRQLATQYGLGNTSTQVAGFVTHGHDGAIDGFSSIYAYIPEHQVGWVVLFNASGHMRARERVTDLVAGFATRGLARPAPAKVDVPAATMEALTGYYRLAGPRQDELRFKTELLDGRNVTLEDGVLFERGLRRRAALVPVAAGLFRHAAEPGASVLFTRAEDGGQAMIAGDAYFERVSPWPHRLHLAVIAAAIALTLSSLGHALVWAPRYVASARVRASGRFAPRGLAALATLAALGLVLALQRVGQSMFDAGTRSTAGVAVFALSIVYPALAAAALVATVRAIVIRQPMTRVARAHALAVALAHVVQCGYLVAWGFVAYRPWAS